MIDRNRLLEIVREAGRMAHARWPGDGHALKTWEKNPGDPVSEADLEVDRFLRRELAALLPSAAWLSEESVDDKGRIDSGLIWLVDPIDGTRDFVRGRPGWAISVALVSSGQTVDRRVGRARARRGMGGRSGQGFNLKRGSAYRERA